MNEESEIFLRPDLSYRNATTTGFAARDDEPAGWRSLPTAEMMRATFGGQRKTCMAMALSTIIEQSVGYNRGRGQKQDRLMKPIFVQLQCAPGKTYEVADAIYQTELVSELYSTSGDYDLLLKVYIKDEQDIGKFINDNIANIPGIVRSLTTLTFRAF